MEISPAAFVCTLAFEFVLLSRSRELATSACRQAQSFVCVFLVCCVSLLFVVFLCCLLCFLIVCCVSLLFVVFLCCLLGFFVVFLCCLLCLFFAVLVIICTSVLGPRKLARSARRLRDQWEEVFNFGTDRVRVLEKTSGSGSGTDRVRVLALHFYQSVLSGIENIYWVFLASPDAPEVIVVTDLLIVSTDLTDVTLVSDDTY